MMWEALDVLNAAENCQSIATIRMMLLELDGPTIYDQLILDTDLDPLVLTPSD